MSAELASLRADIDSLTVELRDRYEEITLLYDLGLEMGAVLDFEEASRMALARSLEVIPARLGVVLVGESVAELRVAVTSGPAGETDQRSKAVGIAAAEVLRTGADVVVRAGEALPDGTAVAEPVLAVALRTPRTAAGEGRMAGVLAFAGHLDHDRFTAADAQLCAVVARQLGQGIRNAQVINELREKERLETDLRLAAGMQRSLLPSQPPFVPGAELAARCRPAQHVGGDYYDFQTGTDGTVSVVVADVSGHGLGPGLIMAMTRSVLRAELRRSVSLAEALAATNAVMWDDLVATEAFITLFLSRYDSGTQQLRYVNAGHQPALLRRGDGQLERLDSDGMPFGIVQSPSYEERVCQLAPGDLVLVVSDGVVEACSPDGEPFGEEGLVTLVSSVPDASADGTVSEVVEHLDRLRGEIVQDDDITVVALHVLPSGAKDGR